MEKQIALQLYTLRGSLENNFEAEVCRVAEIGYAGVETAGLGGTTPEAAAKLFESLNLTIVGAHQPMPIGSNREKVLETIEALGNPRLVCTEIRPADFESRQTIQTLCERLNESYQNARARGISFGVHNHWWEFHEVEGKLGHEWLIEELDPHIFFEVDTYWVKVAGENPVKVVQNLGERAPLLHVKDGPAIKDAPMTALGEGTIDLKAIWQAAIPNAWIIVELDRCATDMMTAVKKSYDYLSGIK